MSYKDEIEAIQSRAMADHDGETQRLCHVVLNPTAWADDRRNALEILSLQSETLRRAWNLNKVNHLGQSWHMDEVLCMSHPQLGKGGR